MVNRWEFSNQGNILYDIVLGDVWYCAFIKPVELYRAEWNNVRIKKTTTTRKSGDEKMDVECDQKEI